MRKTNGDGVDVLLEMSGNVTALRQGLQALTQGGRVSLLGLFEGPVPLDLNTQIIRRTCVCMASQAAISLPPPGIKRRAFYSPACLIPLPSLRIASPGRFDRAMDLIAHGECGKVLLLLRQSMAEGIVSRSQRCQHLAPGLSRQSHPPVDCLGLCQAAGEVRDGASESLSVRAMGLGSGSGEGAEGLPVEGR